MATLGKIRRLVHYIFRKCTYSFTSLWLEWEYHYIFHKNTFLNKNIAKNNTRNITLHYDSSFHRSKFPSDKLSAYFSPRTPNKSSRLSNASIRASREDKSSMQLISGKCIGWQGWHVPYICIRSCMTFSEGRRTLNITKQVSLKEHVYRRALLTHL